MDHEVNGKTCHLVFVYSRDMFDLMVGEQIIRSGHDPKSLSNWALSNGANEVKWDRASTEEGGR